MRTSHLFSCVGLILGVAAKAVLASTTIINLGTLGGASGPYYSYGWSVSSNGSAVACEGGNARAARWTTAGLQDLGSLPGAADPISRGYGISLDGLTVVGESYANSSNQSHAFRWTSAGMQDLGTLGGATSTALAASDTGSVVVGYSATAAGFTHAFRWTSSGMADLGTLTGNASSFALGTGVSADGLIICGYGANSGGNTRAFRWTSAGMTDLGTLGGTTSQANGISADGSVITGSSAKSNGFNRAFRRTSDGMQDLGILPVGTQSFGLSASGDGSVIVGYGDTSGANRGFVWTQALGMVDLNTYLPSIGVNMAGWGAIVRAYGVSADGSAITGWAFYNGNPRAFLVTGFPCPGVPIISDQPQSQVVCNGGTAVFTVVASGYGATYMWRKDGAQISDANGTTLTLSLVTPDDNGSYDCVITTGCGAVTSSAATLTVCVADYNCDTFVSGDDFDQFVLDFELGLPAADVNFDEFVSGEDFDYFVEHFEAGC